MGRIRAALAVLLGRQQTVPQIQAEWAEMKADWLSAFDKLNALIARMAKERKRLTEAQAEDMGVQQDGQPEPQSKAERKAMLRSMAFGGGGGRPSPGREEIGPPAPPDGVGRYVPEEEVPQEEETER